MLNCVILLSLLYSISLHAPETFLWCCIAQGISVQWLSIVQSSVSRRSTTNTSLITNHSLHLVIALINNVNLIYTYEHFSPSSRMFFWTVGWDMETLTKTHMDTRRTCKIPHRQKHELRIKLMNLFCFSKSFAGSPYYTSFYFLGLVV